MFRGYTTTSPLPDIDDKMNPGYKPGPAVHTPVAVVSRETRPQTWYEWVFCIPAPTRIYRATSDINKPMPELGRDGHCAGASNPDPLQEIANRQYTEKLRREYL